MGWHSDHLDTLQDCPISLSRSILINPAYEPDPKFHHQITWKLLWGNVHELSATFWTFLGLILRNHFSSHNGWNCSSLQFRDNGDAQSIVSNSILTVTWYPMVRCSVVTMAQWLSRSFSSHGELVSCYRRHDNAQNPVSLLRFSHWSLSNMKQHLLHHGYPSIPGSAESFSTNFRADCSATQTCCEVPSCSDLHPKLTVSKIQRPHKYGADFLVVKGTTCYNLVFFLSSPQTIGPQITWPIWQPLNVFHFLFNPLDQIYLK